MLSITFDEREYPILCGLCGKPIGRRVAKGLESTEVGCSHCNNWAHAEDAGKIAIDSIIGRHEAKLDNFTASFFAKHVPSLAQKASEKVAHQERYRFTTRPVKL